MGKIDLAEYLRDNGIGAFEKLKENAMDVYTVKLKDLPVPSATLDRVNAIKKFISDELQYMDDTEKKMFIKRDVRNHFDVTRTEINDIIRSLKESNKSAMIDDGYFDEYGKLRVKYLSDYVMSLSRFITFEDTKEIYYYKEGVYIPGGEVLISKIVQTCLGDSSKKHHILEIVNYIQIDTMVPRDVVNHDVSRINVKNGLFNIEKEELEPHTPDYISVVQIPVVYDKNATCPKIEKFLGEVLQPEDIMVIIEFVGYAMIPDTRIQKSVMLVGRGANGKSKLLALIARFIGHNNCSNESLHMLEEDSYSVAELYGKLLNIFPDLASSALYENEMFKQISGDEDRLRARRIYQPPFTFKNTARMIFSANELPPVPGNNFAYFRRWILIHFHNTFTGKDADDDILDKISTPEELSGLFNLAIIGLKRLLKNRAYSYDKSVEHVTRMYKINSDPIAQFADECIVYSDDDCLKSLVYQHFLQWCDANHVEKMHDNTFAKRFVKLGFKPGKQSMFPRLPIWQNCAILVKMSREDNLPGRQKTDTIDLPVRGSEESSIMLSDCIEENIENGNFEKNIFINTNNGSKTASPRTDEATDDGLGEQCPRTPRTFSPDELDNMSQLDKTIIQLKNRNHPTGKVPQVGMFAVLIQSTLDKHVCLADIENRVRQWNMNNWKEIPR